MTYSLLVINGIDFTPCIPVPDYTVNRMDVSDKWTDGNKKEHEYILRSQISGSFTLKPRTEEEYKLFNSTIESLKIASGENSGAVLASVYLNKQDTVANAYLRFTYEPKNELPIIGSKSYKGFSVTVKEV